MATKTKILEEIHPLHLIREVQKRPALYQRNNPEVASAHHKFKLWAEVAQSLFPDWELCSTRTKDDRVTGLAKKWRNLRDTFKRQLDIQKKNRAGANIKRKQYVYYKHMSFLTPHMGEEEQERSASPAPAPAHSPWEQTGPGSKRPRLQEQAFGSANDFTEIDEDKHFLMSLVPSFKRMNEDEKLTAKMEILKVIKTVKENSASATAMEQLSYMPLVDVKLEALTAEEHGVDRAPDEDNQWPATADDDR